MAAITGPSGTQYVKDNIYFTLTGAGLHLLTIAGVVYRITVPASGALTINVAHICKQAFTLAELKAGTTSKSLAWSASFGGSATGSGSISAVYASAQTFDLGGKVTVRYINKAGALTTYEFCVKERTTGSEEVQTMLIEGTTYPVIDSNYYMATLHTDLVTRDTRRSLSEIYNSPFVSVQIGATWYDVEVVREAVNLQTPYDPFVLKIKRVL